MRRTLSLIFFSCIFLPPMAAEDKGALAEAGMPPLGREWSGEDYSRAAKVFSAGKVPLPLLKDAEGQKFIQRLASAENFAVYRNSSIPLAQRLSGFSGMSLGASAILGQYLNAANRGESVYREIALQMAFLVRSSAAETRLIDESLPTIAKDENYPARMAGMKQAYGGMAQIFSGVEEALGEKRFHPEDLGLLLEAMEESLPTVKKVFSPELKAQFRQRLETRRSSFSRPEDLQKIQRMIDELRK